MHEQDGDGSSFLIVSITSKLHPSDLLENPRLARIFVLHQKNEANALEKRKSTDFLLETQEFQCRSISLGRAKGKHKYVTLILGMEKMSPMEDQEKHIPTTFSVPNLSYASSTSP